MSWTDERINLLKRMWKEGKSAAEIAKTLGKGVTRNAVIGKAHRMGLSGRPSPIKKPAPPKKDAAKKETAKVLPGKAAPAPASAKKSASAAGSPKTNALLAKEAEELKKIDKEAVQIGGGVALIDLSERMCKWPIGDPREPDFSFCGRGIRPGTPYCPEHAAMAYQTSSRRGAAQRGAVVANQDKDEDEVEVEDDEEEIVDDDADEETVA